MTRKMQGIGKKVHFDNIYRENPRLYDNISLYQIGDLNCDGGYEIGEHEQYCYEIAYIASGSGEFYTNGRPVRVKKGDVYLSAPGERHNGIADKIDPFRIFYAGYSFENLRDQNNPFLHVKKMFDQARTPVMKDKFNIHLPFLNIFSEIIHIGSYSDLMIRNFLHQIVILAYRNFFENWEKEYIPRNSQQTQKKLVYDVMNHIDTRLDSICDLPEIASELGYSYSYLTRVFTQETGLTIREYYQKKRFEKALELLKNTDASISKIAEDLNYQSIHPFSKAFRNIFGISPTAYRELCKGGVEDTGYQ